MENSNDTVKVIGALLIGALAGAALGVLFAPDKGSKTRSRIADGTKYLTEDMKAKLNNQADALRSQAEELKVLAKDKMGEITSIIKEKTEAVLKHQN